MPSYPANPIQPTNNRPLEHQPPQTQQKHPLPNMYYANNFGFPPQMTPYGYAPQHIQGQYPQHQFPGGFNFMPGYMPQMSHAMNHPMQPMPIMGNQYYPNNFQYRQPMPASSGQPQSQPPNQAYPQAPIGFTEQQHQYIHPQEQLQKNPIN
jgi:hypothetical protein